MRDVCEEVDREPRKYSGLVILGASHGEDRDNRDYLVASDGKGLLTETIVALFHNDARVGLQDRPKCYLFNMCRGTYPNIRIQQDGAAFGSMADHAKECFALDSQNNEKCCGFSLSEDHFHEFKEDAKRVHSELIGSDAVDPIPSQEANEDENKDEGVISFKKGDYMIVHSTLRGFVSNRHRYRGTVFIQELTKSIQKLMKKEKHNFEEVIRRACFEESSHQSSGTSAPQVPEFTTTLRAPFRFVFKGNSKALLNHEYII